MFTKQEVSILVEALYQMPVRTTVADIQKGLHLSPEVLQLINKLTKMNEEQEVVEEPTAAPTETVEAEVSTSVEEDSNE